MYISRSKGGVNARIKMREMFYSQGCSVAVSPGATKQKEQLAGFPLLCAFQHILAK